MLETTKGSLLFTSTLTLSRGRSQIWIVAGAHVTAGPRQKGIMVVNVRLMESWAALAKGKKHTVMPGPRSEQRREVTSKRLAIATADPPSDSCSCR